MSAIHTVTARVSFYGYIALHTAVRSGLGVTYMHARAVDCGGEEGVA
jgi:hypothetical protein